MMKSVLIAVAVALSLLAPRAGWSQEPWPVSLEVGFGRGTGHTSGIYKSNDNGYAADALLATRLADVLHGRFVAAAAIGAQGAGPQTRECIVTPQGGCAGSFPEFTMAAALLGWETSNTALRLMAGPGYVVSDDGALAVQGRINVFLPLASRFGIGVSVRGAFIPRYEGESFRILSGQLVLRIR